MRRPLRDFLEVKVLNIYMPIVEKIFGKSRIKLTAFVV
jgi:hypothetical protein